MTTQTAKSAAPLWLRILRHPIVRIVLFTVMLVLFSKLMSALIPPKGLTPTQSLQVSGADLWLGALRSLVPVSLAYWLLVRGIEGRKVAELAPRKLLPQAGIGWLVGMGIMLATAALMAAFGAYRIHGVNDAVNLLTPLLVLGLLPGITEEILFRGVLFRVVEDGLGTWIAIAFSGLLFGAAHLANPNATWWSSLAIAIEAGLLLGMAYAWTRSLWFCMGLHAAWNFTQGPLLGIPVSGIELKGWLNASTQGPLLISGGEFGAEASLLTVVLCVSLAVFFTRQAMAQGNIRPPFWRRPAPVATPDAADVVAPTSITSAD
ncbi:CPBP family intramembrane glutamic endopeptidase [Arenimonas oryziterrae]|uniref:CAAX prenyl protease 2/Lysostaphin resistance protein A-like domain-containing protein n=1 Tax=Arenimonas oryziterrae DSM 21050 = YC6267 TaxID=1121015 RepID=A0A091BGJ5_9GAMM|nr:type II CAAX endopeptidase family protein [Arenimonas oryziterrae]KFN43455.1 hypothetical protein N789_09270 [Arenimonas oryziterrae DSM 21050 = YC6267]